MFDFSYYYKPLSNFYFLFDITLTLLCEYGCFLTSKDYDTFIHNVAYKLSKKFDHCELMVVRAGHATKEKEITKGLIKASDYFKNKFK